MSGTPSAKTVLISAIEHEIEYMENDENNDKFYTEKQINELKKQCNRVCKFLGYEKSYQNEEE